MRNRLDFILALGALVVAGLSYPVTAEGGDDRTWQLAYLGDSSTRLAQQETPATTPESSAAAEKKGPGWAVNCKSAAADTGLECRLSQTVVTQQGQVLADVTFRIPADKKDPESIVRVPLGIFLPGGATLQVDDKTPQSLKFRACDRNGCYAQGSASAQMLKDLQAGKELKVSFKNLAENDVDVPLSLDGFADAYGKIF
jgi:invasion protein IalB